MPRFSKQSLGRLNTCHDDLQNLFLEVIKDFDCTIIEGHRSPARQAQLYAQGATKVLRGKHNESPSLAVDVAPWYPQSPHIDWDDYKKFYMFGGFVLGVASRMGIEIRWGGDWDSDNNPSDQRFNDLVHFELK